MNVKRVQLVVVLDSSTDNSGGGQVGPSTCFWATFAYAPSEDTHPTTVKLSEESRYEAAILMNSVSASPIRCGLIYNDEDTPNKIFLDGVLRALQACLYCIKKYGITEMIFVGDCEPAIHLLEGKTNPQVASIVALMNQVSYLTTNFYEKAGVTMRYHQVTESEYSLYRDIDAVAKQCRRALTDRMGTKKKSGKS